jgi:hypothetical protein
MHFTARCTPCIAFMLVAQTCTFAIDHVEQGRVEPLEPVLVETLTMSKTKVSPVHLTVILKFMLFFFYLICDS